MFNYEVYAILVLIYRFVLQLVEQDEEGHCNAECKTIERACQEVVPYIFLDYYFFTKLAVVCLPIFH